MLFNISESYFASDLPELTNITHDKGVVPSTSNSALSALKLAYSRSLGHYEGIIQNVNWDSFGDLFVYFVPVGSPAPSHIQVRTNGVQIPVQGSFISIPPKSNVDIYLSSNQANCPYLGLYYHRA
jgi:hypothetical protein